MKAIQYNGRNLDELRQFVPEQFRYNRINHPLAVLNSEGIPQTIREGDWVVRDDQGNFSVKQECPEENATSTVL